MYTPIINKDSLKTNLYPEITEEITRSDDDTVAEIIDRAIEEVKSFLSRFHLTALFGSEADDTSATVTDKLLIGLVKDVATWHLIALANPNISYESIESRYKAAIETLKRIQQVKQTPAGWPLADPADITIVQGNPVAFTSIAKRRNNY